MNKNNYFMSDFGKCERDERLDEAFYILISALRKKRMENFHGILETNIERLMKKISNKAKKIYNYDILPIYENSINPRTYSVDNVSLPIVSLTTISTRVNRVEKTIKSILQQTLKPHSVNLYISEEPYLVDEGILDSNESLKKICDLGVNIYKTKNIGPYRKQYPVVKQLYNSNADVDTPIITIDDDVLYPPNILELLLAEFDIKNHVVAHRGREIVISNQSIASYDNFVIPSKNKNYLNIGTGRNGIAYKLGFFPNKAEYYMGSILAPTADDIWCKWVMAINCISTEILEPKAAFNPDFDFKELSPSDKVGLFHSYNARGTNDKAILNLEKYFKIKAESMVMLYG